MDEVGREILLEMTRRQFFGRTAKGIGVAALANPLRGTAEKLPPGQDRKSTRLNSSHQIISYAVFCLKSKKHTSVLQSPDHLVCRLLIENNKIIPILTPPQTQIN